MVSVPRRGFDEKQKKLFNKIAQECSFTPAGRVCSSFYLRRSPRLALDLGFDDKIANTGEGKPTTAERIFEN